MKVILSGGGTGGHIYPALTIADQIKAIRPDVEITFVGTRQGLEKDIIPRYGYNLEFIDVAGFKRSLSLDTLRSGIKLLHGLKDAYSLLDKLKPDLVIGTGGYVCGPIVFLQPDDVRGKRPCTGVGRGNTGYFVTTSPSQSCFA